MLHAPTSDTSQQADLARANAPAQDLSRSKAPPMSPQRRRAAQMQQAFGNRATLRMLSLPRPAVQTKLTINQPGDAYEQEADRVADQVMRMTDADIALSRAPAQVSRECAACEAEGKPKLQMKSASGGDLAGVEAPPIVHEVLREPGEPLDASTRAFFEPRFGYDFGAVRVRKDGRAATSARSIGASAYTAGRNIAFAAGRYDPGTSAGRRLLAHELTHVIQQHAFLPNGALYSHSPLQRDQSGGGTDAGAVSAADRVLAALNKVDPVGGVGDLNEALGILRGLSLDDLLGTLIEVDNHFMLDVLVSAIGENDQSEVAAAIYAMRFTSANAAPEDTFGVKAARGISVLPESDQDAILAKVLSRRGVAATVQQVRDGMAALLETAAAAEAASGDDFIDDDNPSVAPMMAGVAVGPWSPGRMPIPFYIGNSAHVAIAAGYAGLHSSDAAFYNFTPIAAILQAAAALGIPVSPIAITAAQLGLKPDIANISKLQLYEIKPVTLQRVGRAEAALYILALNSAGLPILPGPVDEPGTAGTIPAPGGWFIYSAPEPGVITYKYRQPKRRRAPATSPAAAPAVDRSLLTRISVATGLTGAALYIYLFISEGSRVAFPPRNAIPVP